MSDPASLAYEFQVMEEDGLIGKEARSAIRSILDLERRRDNERQEVIELKRAAEAFIQQVKLRT